MKCKLTPQPINSVFCEVYGCTNKVKWRVGNPEGPPSLFMQLCESCTLSLLESGKELLKESAVSEKKDVYSCDFCGKEFDNEKSCKMHSIRCPDRQEEGN